MDELREQIDWYKRILGHIHTVTEYEDKDTAIRMIRFICAGALDEQND
jgi:hypothetical protein